MADQSFFRSFSKGDWIGTVAAIVAFTAFLGWLIGVVTAANMADLQTEVALVKDTVADSEISIGAAFATHKDEINYIVEKGLETRTDEAARAMLAMFGTANPVTVRVSNVSMDDVAAMKAVDQFAQTYGEGTSITSFGDKLLVKTTVADPTDAKARGLQTMLEIVRGNPTVQTDIILMDTGSVLEAIKGGSMQPGPVRAPQ